MRTRVWLSCRSLDSSSTHAHTHATFAHSHAHACTVQAGVICGGSSRVQFQRNVVARNGGFGVAVVDAAGGVFTDNSVHESTKCGVVCSGTSVCSPPP
jgi:hypothetical protein